MCGFLAMVNCPWERDFDRALDTLASRGPDAQGQWHDAGVHLGHRRLKVIDLDGGAQPMASRDGRYWIVYNGELYNFQDLRRQLESHGHAFRTRSDTEVLLEAIAHWGLAEALPRFDGMFALAVWDTVDQALLLGRDRLGIKPIYYTQVNGGMVVASTLAPLWTLAGMRHRLNYAALRDYLAQTFVSCPDTILENVHVLEPGTWLRFNARTGQVQTDRYWDLPGAAPQPMNVDDLIEATDIALRESVRRQMVADVDLGVLFSGGIDSSLMAYYMTEASSRPIRTFTVKFDQSARHDEAPIAARVAKTLGSEHHEYRAGNITEEDFRDCIAAMDQPFGDPSFLPATKLSELARQNITVAIGGDGGDELFGGYERYLRDESAYPDSMLHRLTRRGVEAGVLPEALYRPALRGRDRVIRHFSRMFDYPATSRSIASILRPEAADRCDLGSTMAGWLQSALRWTGRLEQDSLMRADLWYHLSQNCLHKTDRASMTHSLEARVPMLGNPVVDLVLPQPASVKLARGPKTVILALAKRYLPREVWDRPKQGFAVPDTQYLFGPWRNYGDHLVRRCADIAPFFNAGEIQRRWVLQSTGRSIDWPLYSVIVLLGWLEQHPMEL